MTRTAILTGVTAVAAALAPAAAAAEDLVLQGAGGALAVSTQAQDKGGKPHVSGLISYRATPADGLTARVDVEANTGFAREGLVWSGAAHDQSRAVNDVGVRLHLDWKALEQAVFAVDAANRVTARPVTTSNAGREADAPFDVRQDQNVNLSASLKPTAKITLSFAGRLRRFSDSLDLSNWGGGRHHFKTNESQASAGVAWAVMPQVKLEAGARLTETEAAWTDSASAVQSYPALLPSMSATLSPPQAGALNLSLSRVATPLDPAKFVAIAQTSAQNAGDLRPDQEWRVAARWKLTLPAAARLELGLESATLESSTELMRVAGREAPGSVAGGRRTAMDVSVDLPLKSFGLPLATLQGRSAWRRSEIADPLTGTVRRRSGEAPHEASLALVQSLPEHRLAWGLSAREQGVRSYYGLNTLSAVETDPSLGAFVEYRPDTFVLRLQLDDIAGGARRWNATYFTDGRDLGAVSRLDHREDGGPGFSLRLKRPL
jgi:hypothetical protein